MSEPLMRVRLRANYGKQSILKDVQFDLCAGEVLGIVGSSGAGKTTLAIALMGLLGCRGGAASGEVLISGSNLLSMSRRQARCILGKTIAVVPQSPMTALNGAISLRAHFEEAWRAHRSSGRLELNARLFELMDGVQLPAGDEGFLRRKPGQISIGQAQRILIALALLHRPSVLVADEPTSALDPETQAEIISLLRKLSRCNATSLVYISHDLMSVLQLCDRVAVLDAGAIVECMPVAEIEQMRHPAALSLFSALPVPVRVLLDHLFRCGEWRRETDEQERHELSLGIR